ncbi:DNA topoisomerase IV subunit A [Ureaplasma sp. ES3154-GEN]|uniref:DNA topoisomerase IV subunit A n=1 Tax=Ureaplasma sp. ES3154-GEN TaxID=2984844 RepID=UPI0021E74843|nr:DNA topoisomerase IV subunit A [Ureaplasma sp. ES3154-GEN]MCV3743273.1 DNA topoisomerase IV subunit A [Ureaplasma sp. ES3154-GEN]
MSKNIINQNLAVIVSQSYAKYAKYIIQDRALPDLRDGLKPVQRRILYAMYDLKITSNQAYKKSARTVGEVIGKYHPHGDSSIYEAMVRMSQDWKNNLCLLDMHGNKGSIDGDNAAAMRYTETRLAKIADLMLEHLDKNTVPFVYNFDDSEKEPNILPALFPNLLINGATGIASGYTTNIPPHNPSEVFDCLIYKVKHPNASIDKLLTLLPAPDFPTGGLIYQPEECAEILKTGIGKFVLRAKINANTSHDKYNQLIISEIPYETNKAEIVKSIDQMIYDQQINGIIEVRDESDAHGISIVIDIKKDINYQNIKQYLYKKTNLQITYHAKMVAIHNRAPVVFNLNLYCDAFINHALDILTKVDQFNLNKINLRMETVQGLMKALDIIDEIIKIIRSSSDKQSARENLINRFAFTYNQAEAIVMMRLYRLTQTDLFALQTEWNELQTQQALLMNRLGNEYVMREYLISLFTSYKKTYGYSRKSIIVPEEADIKIDEMQMVQELDLHLCISKNGYIKTVSPKSFQTNNYEEIGLKDNDNLVFHSYLSNHKHLLITTSYGRCLYLPINKVNQFKWKDLGEHLNTYCLWNINETVVSVFVYEEMKDTNHLIVVTKNNKIKQISCSEITGFEKNKIKDLRIVKLINDDQVVSVHQTANQHQDILCISALARTLIFKVNEINIANRNAIGTKVMSLNDGDYILTTYLIDEKIKYLWLFNNEWTKMVNIDDFKIFKRGLKGVELNPIKKPIFLDQVVYFNKEMIFNCKQNDQTLICSQISYQAKEITNRFVKNDMNIISVLYNHYLSVKNNE